MLIGNYMKATPNSVVIISSCFIFIIIVIVNNFKLFLKAMEVQLCWKSGNSICKNAFLEIRGLKVLSYCANTYFRNCRMNITDPHPGFTSS